MFLFHVDYEVFVKGNSLLKVIDPETQQDEYFVLGYVLSIIPLRLLRFLWDIGLF